MRYLFFINSVAGKEKQQQKALPAGINLPENSNKEKIVNKI